MSALQQSFKVILNQDVIFNASSATLGGQQGLDYLPGSVFLGALATRCYNDLTTEEAWQLFHSGAVRFHDALPLDSQGQITWPVPLSWHHYKGEEFRCANKETLEPTHIFDPALQANNPQQQTRQPKQLRKGYVSENGAWVQPNMHLRMKTAIDPDTGRAAESQLFGYQSLSAGQTYLFTLEADAGQTPLFQKAIGLLTGTLRLGRSRSAQYGRVSVEPVQGISVQPKQAEKENAQLTLWLLSDLALLDQWGQPTLLPDVATLGLPESCAWDKERSYIRTRQYSPFNAYRRAYEQERQVISRGSVLRYNLQAPLTNEQFMNLNCLGLYTETGLGRVAVNPQLLVTRSPSFATPAQTANASEDIHIPRPDSVLIGILESRHLKENLYTEAEKEASRLLSKLLEALRSARQWKGIPDTQPLDAPGKSQWGRIKEITSHHRANPELLWRKITGKDGGESAIIGERSGWGLEYQPGRKLFQEILDDTQLLKFTNQPILADILGQLAGMGLASKKWKLSVEGSINLSEGVNT